MAVPRLLRAVVLTALLVLVAYQVKLLMGEVGPSSLSTAATPATGSSSRAAAPSTSRGVLHSAKDRTERALHTKETTNGSVAEGDMSDVLASRNSLVHDVCQKYGPAASYGGLNKVPLFQLRWLNKRSMIMCFTAKVGTSTWLEYLMEDGFPGVLENATLLHRAAERTLVPPASVDRLLLLQQYGKVMAVRHPFERLVSAYLDKIRKSQDASTDNNGEGSGSSAENQDHKTQGKQLQKNNNENQSGQEQRAEQLKPDEQPQLQQQQPPQSNPVQPQQENGNAGTWTPSFLQFAKYLVRVVPLPLSLNLANFQRIDRHWRPFYANCAPCDIQYQYILAMDTWERDTRFVLNRFGLSVTEELHSNARNASYWALQYFKELPKSLVLELYKRYLIDFEMFGYTTDGYLDSADLLDSDSS